VHHAWHFHYRPSVDCFWITDQPEPSYPNHGAGRGRFALLPISDIPDRPSCHLPQLALTVANRAPQDAVVDMLGSHAGRPVGHWEIAGSALGSGGLNATTSNRRALQRLKPDLR